MIEILSHFTEHAYFYITSLEMMDESSPGHNRTTYYVVLVVQRLKLFQSVSTMNFPKKKVLFGHGISSSKCFKTVW